MFIGRSYEKTKSYSERIAGDIDEEVHAIVQKAYDRCVELLKQNDAELCKVAGFLLEHGTMSRAQFEAAMQGRAIPETAQQSAFQVTEVEEPNNGEA